MRGLVDPHGNARRRRRPVRRQRRPALVEHGQRSRWLPGAPSGLIQVRGPAPRFEHFMYWTATGSGAYAGLTYHGFWFFPEPRSFRPGDKFVWSGWIEEAL